MGDTLLLDSNASGIDDEMTMKKILLVEKKQKEISLLTLNCILGNPTVTNSSP